MHPRSRAQYFHLIWCSLQLEVWLMRPQYFIRDCLACCWISGRSGTHQFWNSLGAVYLFVCFGWLYNVSEELGLLKAPTSSLLL